MLFLDRSVNGVRARRTAFIGALVLSCTLMFASALNVNHTFAAPADDSTAVPTSLSTISSVPVAGMLSDTLQTAWASAFVQQTLDSLLAESPVPGLVVAVTTSDTTLVLHGAGMASMEEGKPMNPDSTVVRVASVSKPVTATLLKTLAARGIIDLDGRVPAPTKTSETPTSITYAHLLAHTSGLDGRLLGGGDPIRQPLLGPLLQRRLPPQIDSVGVLSRYSNEGYAWAGTGAARETDSSFPELATSALFEPLRMNRTTFDGESPLLDTAA